MVTVAALAALAVGVMTLPASGGEPDPTPPPAPPTTGTAQEPDARKAAPPAALAPDWKAPGGTTDPGAFAMKKGSDLSGRVKALDDALPKQGVQKLLAAANREAKTGAACATDPFGKGDRGAPLAPVRKYCWEPDDATSTEWIPQAVSGVSDAQQDEKWGTERPVLIGAYDSENPGRANGCTASESDACNEKGIRVTFLDPATDKYRHVLLAWPYVNNPGNTSFDAVHASENPQQNGIHAGGMVWYGNYLYVADTMNGVRVFDMRYIMDLNPDGDPETDDPTPDGLKSNVRDKRQVGRQNNVWYSYGYRYVMPQVATWTFAATQYNSHTVTTCQDRGAPKASYLSLDRSASPDQLVMGEYCRASASLPSTGRLSAFPLNDETGEIASSGGVTTVADWGNYLPQEGIQGAARYRDDFFLNQSHLYSNGSLFRGGLDANGQLKVVGAEVPTAVGPEDLYVEHGETTGEPPLLWSVSEHRANISDASCAAGNASPCGRVIYAHRLGDVLARP